MSEAQEPKRRRVSHNATPEPPEQQCLAERETPKPGRLQPWWPGAGAPMVSKADMGAFEILVKMQHETLGGIMMELEHFGCKRSHWIWYVFPTDKAGFSDSERTR